MRGADRLAFGLGIDVVGRTRDEIAAVVKLDPLADVAANPKRYQVSFLAKPRAGGVDSAA